MPQIIQFTHPGSEHGPDHRHGDYKSWNGGAHRRKFMRSMGNYVDSKNHHHELKKLLFWGEWEPPSTVINLDGTNPLYPRWLHDPILPKNIQPSTGIASCTPKQSSCNPKCSDPKGLQNTDPFVFGDSFKYFVCKQSKLNLQQETGMTRLEKGSMILFGSTKGKNRNDAIFQLDTVFVVADWIEYDPSTLPSWANNSRDLSLYHEVVYSKAFPQPVQQSIKLRLYRGATFENQVNDMYSFAPAKIGGTPLEGFPRVALKNMDFITNNLNSAPKFTSVDENGAKSAWLKIRNESRQQGCVEAVHFEIPPVA